jgi:hypothetical protein
MHKPSARCLSLCGGRIEKSKQQEGKKKGKDGEAEGNSYYVVVPKPKAKPKPALCGYQRMLRPDPVKVPTDLPAVTKVTAGTSCTVLGWQHQSFAYNDQTTSSLI